MSSLAKGITKKVGQLIGASQLNPASKFADVRIQGVEDPDSKVHVRMTMNNIHITVSNIEGSPISKSTGGMAGFKHRARASPAAAQRIAQNAASGAVSAGYKNSHVLFRGPSAARGQVLLGLASGGLTIYDIKDVTPLPTNGCRPKHARRL